MNQENNDLSSQMAADGGQQDSTTPKNVKLEELRNLVLDLQAVDEEIMTINEHLKEASEKQRELSMNKIPDLFDEMNLSTIKLVDGQTVEVKRTFAASISEERKPFCFNWLRENSHASIIKHDVTVKMKKGEEEDAKKLVAHLNEHGMTYTDKEYVHHQTLKAFVKEQIEKGAPLPQEEFGVFPVRQTKIK